MLTRSGRLLTFTAVMLCLVPVLPIAGAVLAGGDLPEEPQIEWAYPWAHDSVPPEAIERGERIESAATNLEEATAATLFASPASRTELNEALAAFRASAAPFDGDASSPETRVAFSVHEVRKSAEGTVVLTIVLFAVSALAGLLSFLRLRFRGVTLLTCSLLALGAGGGIGALLLFETHPVWMVVPSLLSLVGFFGLLVGTNLLPDANHPWVVAAEDRLRSLPPAKRRVHVVTRVAAGILLAAVAAIGTAASYVMASPGSIYTAYVGALALGLILIALPIIASARVSAGPSGDAAAPTSR